MYMNIETRYFLPAMHAVNMYIEMCTRQKRISYGNQEVMGLTPALVLCLQYAFICIMQYAFTLEYGMYF